MKTLTFVLVFSTALLTACGPSGIAKEEMEKFNGTPTPAITPTPEQTPIPADAIIQVDTSLDGPVLTVNDERQKAVDCTKYNKVSVNADASVVTVKGACQSIVVNGDNNQITADATMAFTFNGTGNNATYSRFANGKQPIVTQNQPGNTTEYVSLAEINARSNANTAKKK